MCESERERERERERAREKERARQRQTQRQSDRKENSKNLVTKTTETDKERDKRKIACANPDSMALQRNNNDTHTHTHSARHMLTITHPPQTGPSWRQTDCTRQGPARPACCAPCGRWRWACRWTGSPAAASSARGATGTGARMRLRAWRSFQKERI